MTFTSAQQEVLVPALLLPRLLFHCNQQLALSLALIKYYNKPKPRQTTEKAFFM